MEEAICGQEVGTKKQSLAAAAKYPANHTLMIGDAPGTILIRFKGHCFECLNSSVAVPAGAKLAEAKDI